MRKFFVGLFFTLVAVTLVWAAGDVLYKDMSGFKIVSTDKEDFWPFKILTMTSGAHELYSIETTGISTKLNAQFISSGVALYVLIDESNMSATGRAMAIYRNDDGTSIFEINKAGDVETPQGFLLTHVGVATDRHVTQSGSEAFINGEKTVTFPVTFDTAPRVFAFIHNSSGSRGSSETYERVFGLSPNTSQVTFVSSSPNSSSFFQWFAIGEET